MEPHSKKLGTDTWFYAKRCFLSLIENLAKQMIIVRDSVLRECLQFLEQCESKSCDDKIGGKLALIWMTSIISAFGKSVKTSIDGPLEDKVQHAGKNTVTYEARLLRALLLQVMKG